MNDARAGSDRQTTLSQTRLSQKDRASQVSSWDLSRKRNPVRSSFADEPLRHRIVTRLGGYLYILTCGLTLKRNLESETLWRVTSTPASFCIHGTLWTKVRNKSSHESKKQG